jgi:hypothetical protein
VNEHLLNRAFKSIPMLSFLLLVACGTPAAKNFGGPWKPVNRFQEQPTAIPLKPAYTFYASPLDETLKTMLARWAKDSGRSLSYRIDFDFTLYKPVSHIRTSSIDDAVAQLNSVYAAQNLSVVANDRQILVEQGNQAGHEVTKGDSTEASSTPAERGK